MGNVLADLREKLGYKTLQEFAADWKLLPEKDKQDLKKAVESGTDTY